MRSALCALLVACGVLRALYASADLHYGRFYDEKFSFANVDSAIRSGTLRPANAFYPSLSYLPQTALVAASHGLYRLTGFPAARVLGDEPGVMTATAILLARLVQVAIGLGVVALTFVAGRRLFDPAVGPLAALLVAVMPNQIRLGAFFKPDILVTLLVLVAFLFTLDVARDATRLRFLKVGIAVGLATAAKYTGVAAALPLVLLVAVRGYRERRILVWSFEAALASIVTFLLVNPHLGPVLTFLPRLAGIYESKGTASGVSHVGMLWEAVKIVVSPAQHGLVLGIAALCGLAAMLARACDRRVEPGRRLELALTTSVPLGYVVAMAAASTLPKVNNYLPITPFTALAAAWFLRGAWLLVSQRLDASWRRPATAVVVSALLLWLVPPAAALCVEPRVPTTIERAQELLERELPPFYLRTVFVEREAGVDETELRLVDLDGRVSFALPERLSAVSHEQLDAADAEVLALGEGRGIDGPDGDFYRTRVERLHPENRARFVARPFRLRGPSLEVLVHPWRLDGEPLTFVAERPPGRAGVAELRLPESLGAGAWVSLSVWLPRVGGIARELSVQTEDGPPMPTARTRARRRQGIHQTPRFELAAAGAAISIEMPDDVPGDLRPRVEVWRWLPPAGARP